MTEILDFLKNLFFLKYLPDLGTNASYGLLFLFGILTSFHCIGMCGGIAISQTIGRGKDNSESQGRDSQKYLIPSLLYNGGRVVSYTIIGAIVGSIGNVVAFNGALKGIIPVVGGIFMIIMAINLLGIFPILRILNISMPKAFAKKVIKAREYGPLFVGLLSSLMPCGPLQIIEIYTLGTKSVIFGALSMFFFALGTVPVLLIFGTINSVINKKHSNVILKASATLVLILGIVMISRGLALFGVSVDVSTTSNNRKSVISKIDGTVQTVTTELGESSYTPIVVQKGIPVKWTIKADADKLNDCNNSIVISTFKVEKGLSEGDNIIEFTPSEGGEIPYTCWMGMIKSKIIVVDDLSKINLK